MSRYAFVFLGLVSFLGACSAGGESGGDPVIVTVPATGGSTGPSISVLSPASGSTGTEISILGSGFNGHLENNLIMFGTTALAPSSASESEVRFLVPSLAAGSYLVSVSTEGEASNSMAFSLEGGSGSSSTGGTPLSNSTLTVSVVDEISGATLSDVLVQVDSSSGTMNAQTDAVGVASFSPISGPVTVTGGKSGYALMTMVGVDANSIGLALEPLATNHIVSGSISLPDGVPSFAPDGAAASGGLQWSAFVTADHEPRFSPLRSGQAPFNEPNTGGNGGLSGQVLNFQLMVYEGQPFKVVRGLLGNFSVSPMIEQATYEVTVSNHTGITANSNLGSLSFQTNSSVNASNVSWLLLSDNENGSISGLPSGTFGSEFISTLVRGQYAGAPSTPSMGIWAFQPYSYSADKFDSYFYNDADASGLQLVTAVVGQNGLSGSTYASSASFDVRSLSQSNPSLPQNVTMPVIPSVVNPAPGETFAGMTPTFTWVDTLGGTNGFYELTLDQLDGSSVRGWRILLSPSTTTVTLPSLGSGYADLKFKQGTGFGASNQIRFVLSAVKLPGNFDFNSADFATIYDGNHTVGRVSLGYAP